MVNNKLIRYCRSSVKIVGLATLVLGVSVFADDLLRASVPWSSQKSDVCNNVFNSPHSQGLAFGLPDPTPSPCPTPTPCPLTDTSCTAETTPCIADSCSVVPDEGPGEWIPDDEDETPPEDIGGNTDPENP
jgi:hypothetical protein